MNKRKKLLIMVMVSVLLFATLNVSAESTSKEPCKDESIYAVLHTDGSIGDLYVVNALENIETDHGNYSSVENLTGLEPLSCTNGVVALPDYDGTFYYQGTIEKGSLPWDIDISYVLDGRQVDAESLAGTSGRLTINIDVSKGDVTMSSFYNTYTLQVLVSLSDNLISNLTADGASIVEAGGKKQITFMVLPGRGAELSLSCDVVDFEMDYISINGVNMTFDVDFDTSGLTGQFDDLHDAVAQLDEGAGEILDGISGLSDGFSQYSAGLSQYASGMDSLGKGGYGISDGLSGISEGLDRLSSQNDSLKAGISALEQAAFDQMNLKLSDMGVQVPKVNKDNYQDILGQDEEMEPFLAELEQSLSLIDGLTEYIDGVGQMSTGVSGLSSSLDKYVDNVSVMAASADILNDRTTEMNDGILDLRDGMQEYKDGISEFSSKTSGLGSEVEETIKDMVTSYLGTGEPLKSFTSDENTYISSVQFFMRTSSVKMEKSKETTVETETTRTFWDRFLRLFGLAGD